MGVDRDRGSILARGGHDEDAVRRFVCTSCGDDWEELYESLFGYESMLHARQRFTQGDARKRQPVFAPVRDLVIRWIDKRLTRAARRTSEKSSNGSKNATSKLRA